MSVYQPKLWNGSEWVDNPDYAGPIVRETIIEGLNALGRPIQYKVEITNPNYQTYYVVSSSIDPNTGRGVTNDSERFSKVSSVSDIDEIVDYYNNRIVYYNDIITQNQESQDERDEQEELEESFQRTVLQETEIEIIPITDTSDMPVSDYEIVNQNVGSPAEYLAKLGSGGSTITISQNQIDYDGTTEVLVTYIFTDGESRNTYGHVYTTQNREESDADYLTQLEIAQNQILENEQSRRDAFQLLLTAEEDRLRAEVTTTSEYITETVEYEMTTRDLYLNKGDFLSEFKITGEWEWKHGGQILYLVDEDISGTSGATKIVFNTGYNFDVRIGFEAENIVEHLDKLGWAEKDGSRLELTTGSGQEAAMDYDRDKGGEVLPATQYLDGILSTQIKGYGGRIEIDIDKTSSNGIAGFVVKNGVQEWSLTNWKIDDEVMINISNPTRDETREIVTTINGLGEIVSEQEEDVTPTPKPPEDEGEGEGEGEGENKTESSWGWWILGGIAVVTFGLILWRMTRRTSQNRAVPSASTPSAPPPVVVNVEGGGGSS
tara:strand:- start:2337 stop:3977 length:1641 start_codon:yes stop_codon:yes gene_type:complete